jgi:hypothetical protein
MYTRISFVIFKPNEIMKTKYLFTVLIVFASLLNGCQKAVQYRDVLYFTGTEASPLTNFTIDGPASLGVSVTSSARMDKDVTVGIKIRPELVAACNEMTGKSYEFPPDGSYLLSADSVVIKNGTNVSGSAKLSVISLDKFTEGSIYCIPITITGSKEGLSILEASQTIYIIVNRTIITQAASLSPNYFTVPSFLTDPSLSSISNITMECRVSVSRFQTANPYISSIIGIEENFLLRFGDVSVANNQAQIGPAVVGGKKYAVTSNSYFSINQLYHVAAVYSGSTVSLYVNGVLDNYTNVTPGVVDLTNSYSGGFHIGFSAGGRLLTGYVSEARVWTRALTGNELQDNLCYVDPTSKGLLAYWRFNGADASGNVTDLTGHGYTAVASRAVTWVPGVRCPN